MIDLGCGTGENALYLADQGLPVVGVDAAPTAIKRARAKAIERGIKASFLVADALDLRLEQTFRVALDCGLFHVFSDAERTRYERSLRRLVGPGGRYFMLCFCDRQPGTLGPRRVSQAEIRATFTAAWRIDAIAPTAFATRDPTGAPRGPRAWLAALTRLADPVRRS